MHVIFFFVLVKVELFSLWRWIPYVCCPSFQSSHGVDVRKYVRHILLRERMWIHHTGMHGTDCTGLTLSSVACPISFIAQCDIDSQTLISYTLHKDTMVLSDHDDAP